VCLAVLAPLCRRRALDPCSTPAFPSHLFYECPAGSTDGSWLLDDHAWLWILMFISQVA
jgi:hypothetical protein